jgi:hypothetical protein
LRFPFLSVRVHDAVVAAKDAEIALLREQLVETRARDMQAQERLLMVLNGIPLYKRKSVEPMRTAIEETPKETVQMPQGMDTQSLVTRARMETGSNNAEVIRRRVQALRDQGQIAPEPVQSPEGYAALRLIDDAIQQGRASAQVSA